MKFEKKILLGLTFFAVFISSFTTCKAQSSTPSPDPTPDNTTIIISELLSAPSNSQEWVELYNPGPQTINIDGWYLEDQLATPSIIAQLDGIINPNQAVVVYLSSQKLNNSADGATLKNQLGKTIDTMAYTSSTTDLSWNRQTTDPNSTWFESTPTPGFFVITSPSPSPTPSANTSSKPTSVTTPPTTSLLHSLSQEKNDPQTPIATPNPVPSPAIVPWWPDPKLPDFTKVEMSDLPSPKPEQKNLPNTNSSRASLVPTTPADVIIGGLLLVSGSGNLLISALRSKTKLK